MIRLTMTGNRPHKGTERSATRITSPNDTRHVVWALCEVFLKI